MSSGQGALYSIFGGNNLSKKDVISITNNGTLIPMANFSGGETVFNHQQVENLWDWSKFSPSQFNVNVPTLPDFVPREREVVNSPQYVFNGGIHIDEIVDYNDFMDELNTKISMIAPITNRMK